MVNPSLDEEIKNEKEVSESVCKVRLLITGNGICGFGKTEKVFQFISTPWKEQRTRRPHQRPRRERRMSFPKVCRRVDDSGRTRMWKSISPHLLSSVRFSSLAYEGSEQLKKTWERKQKEREARKRMKAFEKQIVEERKEAKRVWRTNWVAIV